LIPLFSNKWHFFFVSLSLLYDFSFIWLIDASCMPDNRRAAVSLQKELRILPRPVRHPAPREWQVSKREEDSRHGKRTHLGLRYAPWAAIHWSPIPSRKKIRGPTAWYWAWAVPMPQLGTVCLSLSAVTRFLDGLVSSKRTGGWLDMVCTV